MADSISRVTLQDTTSASFLAQSSFEGSFEGSKSGNLLESTSQPDADRLISQNSDNSLNGSDAKNLIMDKVRMCFQAHGLGNLKTQSSKDLSFTDQSSEGTRTSMSRKHSNRSSLQYEASPSASSRIITAYSLRSGKSLMSDESRITTQLKTWLKLSHSFEPTYVLNEKKRKNIFQAIKLYHRNDNIARLSVTCLELLASKTEDKAVFSEIMKNFGNLAALVGTHATNIEFAQNFLKLVVHIIKKNEASLPQLDDPAYVETFWQIKDEHASNKDIQHLHSIIINKLGIKKRGIDSSFLALRGSVSHEKVNKEDAFAKLKRRMKAVLPPNSKLALELAESQSSGYEYSSNLPDTSLEEKLDLNSVSLPDDSDAVPELDEWGADDLTDVEGELVSWELDDDNESVINLGKATETSGRTKLRTYTARRLKELQMQNAQREQSLIAHKEALGKIEVNYKNVKDQYNEDMRSYANLLSTMEETEKKSKVEIAKLKQENELMKITEAEVCEQSGALVNEMEIVRAELNEKNQQFENMKAMVTQQMNEAKSHYVGVRQRLEQAKAELAKLQDMLLETENKLTTTQKEQEKKVAEYNNLQITYQAKQKEYEDSRKKAASLENRYNTIRSDFSSKIATNHQELAKGQSDIRLAHQMHGIFKSQLMKLKMEKKAMLKNLQALKSLNSEGNRVDIELKHLKKENVDLNARLGDLLKNDVSGERLRNLQLMNEKLKKEKKELMQMTEMLLPKQVS